MTLEELKKSDLGARKRAIKSMTIEEKLSVVDEIIDRDAATWKELNRRGDGRACDFSYYFRTIDGGIALTERQR